MLRQSRNYRRQFKRLKYTNDIIGILQQLAAECMQYKREQPEKAEYWQQKFEAITRDAETMIRSNTQICKKLRAIRDKGKK